MKVLQTCLLSSTVALVMLSSALPAQASLLGDALKLLIKTVPGTSVPTPSGAKRAWPPVGLLGAEKVLEALPENIRPKPQEINDAYITLLARAGLSRSLMTACPSCVPINPKLPDEAMRAAKLMLENDTFLAGKGAGETTQGALVSLSPHTGKRVASAKGTSRDKVIAALAEAMSGLREGSLAEAEFAEALATNLRTLAEEPKNKFGLEGIDYDAKEHTLTFKARYRDTTVAVANLDI